MVTVTVDTGAAVQNKTATGKNHFGESLRQARWHFARFVGEAPTAWSFFAADHLISAALQFARMILVPSEIRQ